jgi:hypothetical protein
MHSSLYKAEIFIHLVGIVKVGVDNKVPTRQPRLFYISSMHMDLICTLTTNRKSYDLELSLDRCKPRLLSGFYVMAHTLCHGKYRRGAPMVIGAH